MRCIFHIHSRLPLNKNISSEKSIRNSYRGKSVRIMRGPAHSDCKTSHCPAKVILFLASVTSRIKDLSLTSGYYLYTRVRPWSQWTKSGSGESNLNPANTTVDIDPGSWSTIGILQNLSRDLTHTGPLNRFPWNKRWGGRFRPLNSQISLAPSASP